MNIELIKEFMNIVCKYSSKCFINHNFELIRVFNFNGDFLLNN